MVVLVTLDSVVRGLAVMLLVFLGLMVLLLAAVWRVVLQRLRLVLRPLVLAMATRGLGMATAGGGIGLMALMPPMAVRMPPAIMAATTLPPTGEARIGAFSSAMETEK
jgi:hypothetical protein